MLKRRRRWDGTLQMRQAVLHPLVWRTLMQKRQTQRKGRREAKGFRSSRSSSPSSKSVAEDSLNSGVWKYLPHELMERILDILPLRSVIPYRTVCKRWNAHIVSTRLPSAPLSKKTVLVYFPPDGAFLHQPLTVYNASRNGWETHDMSFLHDGGLLGSYSLVAADRGLLCFCDSTWTNFVVCNPLSKQWELLRPPTSVLPHIPGMQVAGSLGNYILVGLVVSEDGGSYQLVLAGLTPKTVPCRRRVLNLSQMHQAKQSRTTFVYSSRFRAWNPAPALPMPHVQQDFGVWSNDCPRRSVTSEGKLYWSVVERSEEDDIPVREVVRFDIERGHWCTVALEEHNVRDLVALNGKALAMKLWDGMRLMVRHRGGGGLRAFYGNVGVDICSSEWEGRIFEIEDDGDTGGIRLTRRKIPKVLQDAKKTEKATSDYSNQYSCIGQGTSLFVMHQVIDGDISGEWEMQGWKVLHYDSFKDSCVRLPQLNTYSHEQFPLSWWILQPSLAAFM